MPDFRAEIEVDAYDWWEAAYKAERDEMIEIVRDEIGSGGSQINLMHDEFLESLNKLSSSYYMMTKEEIDLLLSLAKRF
jgi:hypothetical protein